MATVEPTNIVSLVTDNLTPYASPAIAKNQTQTCDFNYIQLEAVMKQLSALGNTSNNDVLVFDSKLLFLGAEIIAPILTNLYNASLTNKIVI